MNDKVTLWVNNIYRQCVSDTTVSITVDESLKKIVCARDNNRYRVEKGISYCHPDDVFCAEKGVAIAYARLEKLIIPPYVLKDELTLQDVKIGQIFDSNKTQERYVKVTQTPTGGWRCTNVVTGKHIILPESELVQIPFKW